MEKHLGASFAAVIIAVSFASCSGAYYFLQGAVEHLPQQKNGRGVLEIREAAGAKIYGRWHIDDADVFAIEFIHSVNQTPVRETFRIDDGNLLLDNVRFYSLGAGMHSDLTGAMELSRDEGAMVVSGFSFSLKEINLIAGTISDHILFINDEVVSLQELCGANARITIQFRLPRRSFQQDKQRI